MSAPDPRAALRQVFAEELDEHLATLERSAALLEGGPDAEATRGAVAEIFRAVHSSKGAARAAGFPEVERFCHDLETRLGPLREAHDHDAGALAGMARDAARFFGAAAARLHRPAGSGAQDAAGAGGGAPGGGTAEAPAGEVVRVSVQRLDELQAVVESVCALLERGAARTDAENAWREASAAARRVAAQTRSLRVMPFSSLRPSVELAAVELARRLGREVSVVFEGGDAELDRRVLDALREPLVHLVRNAIDHGIEPPEERVARRKPRKGTLRVAIALRGHDAEVTIADDGRGVDREAVRQRAHALGVEVEERDLLGMIFEPGFTTRAEATAVSGRGVGLDVVRQRIGRLQGRVAVESHAGSGTSITLTVPLDLTVIRGVVFRAREILFVVATTAVERLARVAADEVASIGGKRYLVDSGERLVLADASVLFGGPPIAFRPGARQPCLVLASGGRRAAFVVDELLDERELVVRPLAGRIRRLPYVSATVVLGDGGVAYVCDASDLVQRARPSLVGADTAQLAVRRRVLVVDDSITTRQLERTLLESAGFEVAVAADGAAAWRMLTSDPRFDLVLSDIEMPHMDGFQLLARIRADRATATLPVMLVTALESDADRQRALDLGASAYVLKRSFDQAEFLAALESLL